MAAKSRTTGDVLIQKLNGRPVLLGIIAVTDGSSKTNASTATPFTLTGGAINLIISDTAMYINWDGAASSIAGMPWPANVPLIVNLLPADATVAVKPQSGNTLNCWVMELR